MLLSIISPVYNAEKIVYELVKRIVDEVEKITSEYEIILVDDYSKDNSWVSITQQCEINKKVKGIKLSRNFGQHYAISAGLEASLGEYVVVMDCDLQDNPKYIHTMYTKALEGNHIVYTVKKERKHGFIKTLMSKAFFMVFNFLTNNKKEFASANIGSYTLLSKQAVKTYNSIKDYRRHYLMVLNWIGLKSAFINIEHEKRFEGTSSYNLKKLIIHAIDGITSQSDKLLQLTALLGFILSSISFLSIIVIIIRYLYSPFQAGWASIVVLILLMSGLIILSIGICGIYIGKIFEQTKNRPLYIVENKLNF